MNLKEKNEQIALMLGWRQGNIDPLEQRWKNQWFTSHGNSHKILLFRLDWNWIMIAVEFIESIQDGIYQVDILQEGCKISLHCTNTFIDETVSKASEPLTKLESTFLAVAEFAFLYNHKLLKQR